MATNVGSGIGASLGIAAESTWGTYVAPTRFTEFETESVVWKPTRTMGKGLYAGGLVTRQTQRQTTSATVEGDIVTPVYTKGMGLWLGLIFGTLGITPVQQASTAAYLQTHALADNHNQSVSLQIGRPSLDQTVNPYSYIGVKATKAVFEAKKDEPLRLTVSIDGKDQSTSNSLTTPSYVSSNPALFWNEGQFEMGAYGSEALVEGVTALTLTIERGQDAALFYMDGTGRKSQQQTNDFIKITGEIETTFTTQAAFSSLFTADTAQSIIVPFTGANIASSYYYGLTLQIPNVRFDDGTPNVTGPDIIRPKVTFTAEYDDTHTPITALYTSTDTTL